MSQNSIYHKIIVPLDHTTADRTILDHVQRLATIHHSDVIFFHVADGWAARYFRENAASIEIESDTEYLDQVKEEMESRGHEVEVVLGYGNPAEEIIKLAEEREADLIAMSTHGHRWLMDLILGSVVDQVRHGTGVPVLLLNEAKTTAT